MFHETSLVSRCPSLSGCKIVIFVQLTSFRSEDLKDFSFSMNQNAVQIILFSWNVKNVLRKITLMKWDHGLQSISVRVAVKMPKFKMFSFDQRNQRSWSVDVCMRPKRQNMKWKRFPASTHTYVTNYFDIRVKNFCYVTFVVGCNFHNAFFVLGSRVRVSPYIP